MDVKYLLLTLSGIALAQTESKRMIRSEVSTVILKSLIGVVLASTLVFSIIQLLMELQKWLDQFENKFIYEFIGFSFVIAACTIMLYYLFSRKLTKSVVKNITSGPLGISKIISTDFPTLAIRFAEGFMEGLEFYKQTQKSKNRYIEDMNVDSNADF